MQDKDQNIEQKLSWQTEQKPRQHSKQEPRQNLEQELRQQSEQHIYIAIDLILIDITLTTTVKYDTIAIVSLIS